MHEVKLRHALAALLPFLLLGLTPPNSAAQSGASHILPAPRHLLFVYGSLVKSPVAISSSTIQVMPQVKVEATPDQGKKAATYSGVSLAELLGQAGVSLNDPSGKKNSFSVTAIGKGGKQVALPPSAVRSLLHGGDLVVADAINGKPLPKSVGPLEFIVATDKDSSRWVPNLARIRIDSAK